MTMTRDEVEREADEIMKGQSLPEHARPSFIAFLERSNGLPIDQECPYCHGVIWVKHHGRFDVRADAVLIAFAVCDAWAAEPDVACAILHWECRIKAWLSESTSKPPL